jgi:translation elongation factor P/translation initiation factor 5A
MEVIEIISNFINKDNNVVEVQFRVRGDNEDVVRVDTIEFEYLNDFGYGVNFMTTDIFEDIDDDWDLGFDDDDDDFFIDEDDLILFLNEYYLVFEDRLPGAEYR